MKVANLKQDLLVPNKMMATTNNKHKQYGRKFKYAILQTARSCRSTTSITIFLVGEQSNNKIYIPFLSIIKLQIKSVTYA